MRHSRIDLAGEIALLVAQQGGCALERVRPETRLAADLGFRTLDLVELVCALEQRFGIEIRDEAMEVFITVADIVAWLTPAHGSAPGHAPQEFVCRECETLVVRIIIANDDPPLCATCVAMPGWTTNLELVAIYAPGRRIKLADAYRIGRVIADIDAPDQEASGV
jgi:acyl carrier protein